jgi:hypothetical protein
VEDEQSLVSEIQGQTLKQQRTKLTFVTTLRPPAISAIRRAFGDGITRIGTATDVVFHLRVLGWEHIDRLDQLPEFVR